MRKAVSLLGTSESRRLPKSSWLSRITENPTEGMAYQKRYADSYQCTPESEQWNSLLLPKHLQYTWFVSKVVFLWHFHPEEFSSPLQLRHRDRNKWDVLRRTLKVPAGGCLTSLGLLRKVYFIARFKEHGASISFLRFTLIGVHLII